MKVFNAVKRAPKNPRPGQVYGAKMEGLTLNGKSITAQWAIFPHKNRRKRGGKSQKQA